ncbi:2-succinyl-6-hydroxy-2,4-cyclohexadiene-1-carboxylate synthase [Listeria fleischmannii]|uniref:2-succinyl-6-hydroxy-2, 4-cyclohexadiene-1-carboxylate synthase n=1 Tax=Listeria fleischmannii TaxID=1069827 RepID=UPI001625E199|nr:2-succinyl-6-hydroxy-2,4-cyclohexadiene-1-carboxylate synthase [Listeria fleischmannii]MBC1419998.1 2-succinyl-6-hydroxy-2,4-cyclohexadiene-1-carboxylate synthase [Listeria fleischmannii]
MKLFSHFVDHHEKLDMMWLHGFTGTHQTFCQLDALNANLILPDLPGHGKSDSNCVEDYSLSATEAALNALLRPKQKTILAGYSMGARLAMSQVMQNQNRFSGLVMISGSPGLQTGPERLNRRARDAELAQFIKEKGLTEFVSHWENLPLFASQKKLNLEVQERIRRERLSQSESGLMHSLAGVGTGSLPSYWDKLSSLSMPVLLITGELDKKFCDIAQKMADLLPNVTYVCVADAGHAVHLEAPEEVSKIINKWLNNHF